MNKLWLVKSFQTVSRRPKTSLPVQKTISIPTIQRKPLGRTFCCMCLYICMCVCIHKHIYIHIDVSIQTFLKKWDLGGHLGGSVC